MQLFREQTDIHLPKTNVQQPRSGECRDYAWARGLRTMAGPALIRERISPRLTATKSATSEGDLRMRIGPNARAYDPRAEGTF